PHALPAGGGADRAGGVAEDQAAVPAPIVGGLGGRRPDHRGHGGGGQGGQGAGGGRGRLFFRRQRPGPDPAVARLSGPVRRGGAQGGGREDHGHRPDPRRGAGAGRDRRGQGRPSGP